MRIKGAIIAILLPFCASAEQPLSAITWLDQNSDAALLPPILNEPPVTNSALLPQIETRPLKTLDPPIGLVPARVTGLPDTLWQHSDPDRLAELIAQVPVRDVPALQTLLYSLLLSEAYAPEQDTSGETLLLARIDRLLELGAADPAQELAQHADPARNAARFSRWFDATLLTGDEDRSCSALTASPHLAPDYSARIYCYALRGNWETAALTLESAHALELMPKDRLALLDRFLSPEIFEGAPPLPAPDHPDPLTFRLFEAIGERLPTRPLPRAFAMADLRDVAGWKAQLEASERLARTGALPANRLLGIFTERRPAASGGIWDRVRALQQFETALDTGSDTALSKTLPASWRAVQSARLEVAFATLFADRLCALDSPHQSLGSLIWEICLLSDGYEEAARLGFGSHPRDAFLAALARGEPETVLATDTMSQAIQAGFDSAAELPLDLSVSLKNGALGETILRAMALLDSGAKGNPRDLSMALATLRALGLEDTARRASLQILLLERT